MRSGTAPCGLRYAVRRGGSAVGYCALSLRCGTRDEDGFGNGIAHFAEHTMFRGTARKSASVINSYLDRLGSELNAYTTKEEIVLHATVLKEDLGKAAGLLFELATEATFPDAEIETERGVVPCFSMGIPWACPSWAPLPPCGESSRRTSAASPVLSSSRHAWPSRSSRTWTKK